LRPQAFVGTNAVIACLVDAARIVTYVMVFLLAGCGNPIGSGQWPLILAAMAAAFAGVRLGKSLLPKVTMGAIQTLTGVLLLLIALGLASGLI